MSFLATIRSGPMLHEELASWHKGRTGSDVVTTAMANYLAATGQMSNADAARVSSGHLSEDGRNQVFNRASMGRHLTSVSAGRPAPFIEKAAGLGSYALGTTENQPIDTTSSITDSGVSGSSLSGSGLA